MPETTSDRRHLRRNLGRARHQPADSPGRARRHRHHPVRRRSRSASPNPEGGLSETIFSSDCPVTPRRVTTRLNQAHPRTPSAPCPKPCPCCRTRVSMPSFRSCTVPWARMAHSRACWSSAACPTWVAAWPQAQWPWTRGWPRTYFDPIPYRRCHGPWFSAADGRAGANACWRIWSRRSPTRCS